MQLLDRKKKEKIILTLEDEIIVSLDLTKEGCGYCKKCKSIVQKREDRGNGQNTTKQCFGCYKDMGIVSTISVQKEKEKKIKGIIVTSEDGTNMTLNLTNGYVVYCKGCKSIVLKDGNKEGRNEIKELCIICYEYTENISMITLH